MVALAERPSTAARNAHRSADARATRRDLPQYDPPAHVDLALWRARLKRISPLNPWVGSLHLAWVPGTPDEPVNRWMVYELVPERATSPIHWAAEQRVRWAGLADLGRPVLDERYHLAPPLFLDPMQHQLWRETGRVARPLWVVQGTHGGHRTTFNPVEQRWLHSQGLPKEPPAPGTRPYAPFDYRAFHQVAALDKATSWARAKSLHERDPDYFDAEEAVLVDAMSQKLEAWLDQQVKSAWDSVETYRGRLLAEFRGE